MHFQQKVLDPHGVAEEVFDELLEFNRVNNHLESKNESVDASEHDLNPKNLNIIQVDVGCYQEGCFSFGCIIRNHNNYVTMVASKKEIGHVELGLDELLEVRWVLQLAKNLNLDGILL